MMLGNADIRPIVYGFAGRSKMSWMFPFSNRCPPYMIPIFSATSATTEMSWVMIIIAMFSSRWRSRISARIRSCMITSRAVVGSSAIRSCGLHARAIAIMDRCRIPPLNSCG